MKKSLLVSFLLFGLFAYALPALAVPVDYLQDVAKNLGLPYQYDSFSQFVTDMISVLLSVIFVIAALFAIIAGYRMATSGGNEETLEKARSSLTWAIGGMVVVLLAWVLVSVVARVLNTGNPEG